MAPFGLVRGLVSGGGLAIVDARTEPCTGRPAGGRAGVAERQPTRGHGRGRGRGRARRRSGRLGGWPVLAAAAVASVCSWSAVSKLVGWPAVAPDPCRPPAAKGRGADRCGPSLWSRRRARLLLMGSARGRRAALVAPGRVLDRAGSGAPARRRGLPCGCFGGRDAVDVRTALVRNAGLGLLATVVALFGLDRPAIRGRVLRARRIWSRSFSRSSPSWPPR